MAYFDVATVKNGGVSSRTDMYNGLCRSNSLRGYNGTEYELLPIRPVAILPANLQVEKQEDGTYLLVE